MYPLQFSLDILAQLVTCAVWMISALLGDYPSV